MEIIFPNDQPQMNIPKIILVIALCKLEDRSNPIVSQEELSIMYAREMEDLRLGWSGC